MDNFEGVSVEFQDQLPLLVGFGKQSRMCLFGSQESPFHFLHWVSGFSSKLIHISTPLTAPLFPRYRPWRFLIVHLGFGRLCGQMPAVSTCCRVDLMLNGEFAEMSNYVLHLGVASAAALAAEIVKPGDAVEQVVPVAGLAANRSREQICKTYTMAITMVTPIEYAQMTTAVTTLVRPLRSSTARSRGSEA